MQRCQEWDLNWSIFLWAVAVSLMCVIIRDTQHIVQVIIVSSVYNMLNNIGAM